MTKIISAFAIGIGVGAALGVLFAPSSGEETRGYLMDRAQDGLDQATSRAKDVARRAQKTVSDVRDTVTEAAAEGQRAYRDATASS